MITKKCKQFNIYHGESIFLPVCASYTCSLSVFDRFSSFVKGKNNNIINWFTYIHFCSRLALRRRICHLCLHLINCNDRLRLTWKFSKNKGETIKIMQTSLSYNKGQTLLLKWTGFFWLWSLIPQLLFHTIPADTTASVNHPPPLPYPYGIDFPSRFPC